MQAYFGWAKPCSCSWYFCSRHLWFYDSGRLGRVQIVTLTVGARAKEGKGRGGGEKKNTESRAVVEWFQFRVISMVFTLIDHSSRLIMVLKSPCYKIWELGSWSPHSRFQNLFHRYPEYNFLPQPGIGAQILANPASRVAVNSRRSVNVFPNPTLCFGQIPDPGNILPGPVSL